MRNNTLVNTLTALTLTCLAACGGGKTVDVDVTGTSLDSLQAPDADVGASTDVAALKKHPVSPTPVTPRQGVDGATASASGSPVAASPDSTWYTISLESESGTVAAPAHLRFGTPQQWVYADAKGAYTCDLAFFKSDPNVGVYKQCQTDDPSAKSLNVKIMLIGDSITGFYSSYLVNSVAAEGFRHVDFVGNAMYSYHAKGDPDPDNNGYGGYKGFSLLKAPGTSFDIAAAFAPGIPWGYLHGDESDLPLWFRGQAPDIVLLHLGTNDGVQGNGINQDDRAVTEMTVYSRILASARAANPKVRFFVAQIIPNAGTPQWPAALHSAVPLWAASNTTALSPVTVVDQYTGVDISMLRDGTHPNDSLATSMAGRWLAAIAPYLR